MYTKRQYFIQTIPELKYWQNYMNDAKNLPIDDLTGKLIKYPTDLGQFSVSELKHIYNTIPGVTLLAAKRQLYNKTVARMLVWNALEKIDNTVYQPQKKPSKKRKQYDTFYHVVTTGSISNDVKYIDSFISNRQAEQCTHFLKKEKATIISSEKNLKQFNIEQKTQLRESLYYYEINLESMVVDDNKTIWENLNILAKKKYQKRIRYTDSEKTKIFYGKHYPGAKLPPIAQQLVNIVERESGLTRTELFKLIRQNIKSKRTPQNILYCYQGVLLDMGFIKFEEMKN